MNERFESAEQAEKVLGKKVKISGKVIEVHSGALGLKLLGAVDYLVNNHKYIAKFIRG